ncbi:plasmid mobilization relaxosome protein MobC [Acinetobacter towneri]|uniref:Plasmid mobilization relaxosome protein MobC n=1 Tax=Acinetobacter towneri TaxID=202956 RepID=A0AB35M2R2_9GAMM|nr:plasmid mobilization relaxosome protein MobC [Acinetobacter towneri]MDM1719911.1 plasmid mobilization relaxosome protein MobC [Acinetobacter towneri]MDM1731993.1 plasmid mobilization relaxosome protein MobC [Acinetobacter towneri]MDM1734648.1 plasmid mobilization relaxosome protein MobC [Acinetobacter towneri]MDM1739988.1 plasmid mobilization relaxosome protein MobC [Acinetobacter towneri]MDM1742640.1 plasmid mobilization relaxosome protein MobC [Acinetobacter towneri]
MRSKSKIFRLTPLQLEQLEKHIEKENTNFTDFIHSLIQREVMQDAVTVRQSIEEERKPRLKIKTVIEIVKRFQRIDPALLLELSRIGNNLNQIARALNIIKNSDSREQRKLDIFACLQVLKAIQNDLEQVFPALPKIGRQSPDRLQKQLEDLNVDQALPSIVLAEKDESAY